MHPTALTSFLGRRPLSAALALASLLGGAALAAPAQAQEAPRRAAASSDAATRLAQLEAENAVLKLEVRALRSRVDALEEMFHARGAASLAQPPALDAAELRPSVSAERRSIIAPRASPVKGAATPEEALRALAEALARMKQSPEEIAAALGAFEPDEVYSLESLWPRVRPKGFEVAPTREELVAAIHGIGLPGWREARCTLVREDGASTVLDVRLGGDATAVPIHLVATTVRVNGRCLIAHLKRMDAVDAARKAVEDIASAMKRVAAHGGARPASLSELDGALGAAGEPMLRLGGSREGDRVVRIAPYLVELAPIGAVDYTIVAAPDFPTYPTLLYGPVPNAHDPLKNPYVVRQVGGWTPPRLGPEEQPGGDFAVGKLRSLTTAQALFREGDKDHNALLDYSGAIDQLVKLGLVPLDPAGEDGVSWTQGWGFRILSADQFTWSAIAFEPGRPGGERRSFYVDESGVIRGAFGETAGPKSTAIGGGW